MKKKKKKNKNKVLLFFGKIFGTYEDTKRTWAILRPITIYLISIILVVTVFAVAISYTFSYFFGPTDKNDHTPKLFYISKGASMSNVATNLKEQGLVNNSLGIKLLADFTSVSSKIQSGEYVLDRSMSPQDILDVITKASVSASSAKVTIIEGSTVEGFAKALEKAGVISSAKSFTEECKHPENYAEFYFVQSLIDNKELLVPLEGYLFPDTYEFFTGSSNSEVIQKLLSRMNYIYSPAYSERADSLGLSMHQIITLASLIEKEGKTADFKKISAVFHNRLKTGMYLNSDVTVQYALNVKRLVLTQEELDAKSPYNTYVVKGLPAGPICSPSKDAIYAALYPDEELLNGNYLYFTLTDPYTGEIAYSKTYEEHLKIKNQYQSAWENFDKEQGAQ